MTHSKLIGFLTSAAVLPLVALAVAACGGGGATAAKHASSSSSSAKSSTSSTPTATPTSSSAPSGTVRVASSSLGKILVNSSGLTLYLFKGDVGTTSECTGACAAAWPPLLAKGRPTAGTGVSASKLGTTARSGGTKQVTYNGHPLYLFIQDTKPGDVTGQGVTAFGAPWFALTPAGTQASAHAASASTAGGGGTGY